MDKENKNNKIGIIVLLITACVWGIAFAFQRTGMESVGPMTFMASRCVLASISLAIVCLVMYRKNAFKMSKETVRCGIICGCILALANDLQQIGMVYTSAGKAGFITAMYIILVPILGWIIFKRKPEKKVWLAVLLGAIGLFLLCVKEDFTVTVGDLWVIACSFTFSMHILVTDHFIERIEPIKMSLMQFIVCTIVSWIVAFIFEKPQLSGIWDARIAIGYCGVISAGVGYTLQIVGQKNTKPETASLVMSLESVFAAFGGWLILNEVMSGKELVGAALMFIAIIIVQIRR